MPRYAVEREYLLPVYQRIELDAKNRAQACRLAIDAPDWETPDAVPDFPGRGKTFVVALAPTILGLTRRGEREVGSPGVPEQHQGGLHVVSKVAGEIDAQILELIAGDSELHEIERLQRWRNLLRQVT